MSLFGGRADGQRTTCVQFAVFLMIVASSAVFADDTHIRFVSLAPCPADILVRVDGGWTSPARRTGPVFDGTASDYAAYSDFLVERQVWDSRTSRLENVNQYGLGSMGGLSVTHSVERGAFVLSAGATFGDFVLPGLPTGILDALGIDPDNPRGPVDISTGSMFSQLTVEVGAGLGVPLFADRLAFSLQAGPFVSLEWDHRVWDDEIHDWSVPFSFLNVGALAAVGARVRLFGPLSIRVDYRLGTTLVPRRQFVWTGDVFGGASYEVLHPFSQLSVGMGIDTTAFRPRSDS